MLGAHLAADPDECEMNLPFSIDQFLGVFQQYNTRVFPAQWILLFLAVFAVVTAINGGSQGSRAVSGVLALLWIWMGVVYHWAFFRSINPMAPIFAALFIVEGLLIVWFGVVRSRLAFELTGNAPSIIGMLLIVYALLAYPTLGYLLGHQYPAAPTFGVPCPTTIFTLGMMLLCRPPRSRVLLVIPVAWAVVGAVAAMQLGMREDLGLVVAAIVATVIAFGKRAPTPRSSKSHLTTAAM
jgi:uncharacterized protein DUF6064